MVRKITDTTSVDLAGLVAGEPISLYIVINPVRLKAHSPLLRLLLSGLLKAFAQRSAMPEYRTLMLCDEIASLGRMDAFLIAASLMRGWGVTLWSFWQNPAQLQIYGNQADTLLDNAGVVQLLGARNRRMAQEFSYLIGGIDPDEIVAMSPENQILLVDGGSPKQCKRMRYFEEPMFEGLYDDGPLFHERSVKRMGG